MVSVCSSSCVCCCNFDNFVGCVWKSGQPLLWLLGRLPLLSPLACLSVYLSIFLCFPAHYFTQMAKRKCSKFPYIRYRFRPRQFPTAIMDANATAAVLLIMNVATARCPWHSPRIPHPIDRPTQNGSCQGARQTVSCCSRFNGTIHLAPFFIRSVQDGNDFLVLGLSCCANMDLEWFWGTGTEARSILGHVSAQKPFFYPLYIPILAPCLFISGLQVDVRRLKSCHKMYTIDLYVVVTYMQGPRLTITTTCVRKRDGKWWGHPLPFRNSQ